MTSAGHTFPPRVLFVTSTLAGPLGGAEQYCIQLAEWLQRRGYVVFMASAVFGNEAHARLRDAGVPTFVIKTWRPYPSQRPGPRLLKPLFHLLDLADLLSWVQMRRLVHRLRATHVHIHRFQGLGPWIFRATAPSRTIHTVHDFALVDTSTTTARRGSVCSRLPAAQQARTRILGWLVPQNAQLVFPSRRTLERHQELGFARGGRPTSHVIPHGWESSYEPSGAVPGGSLLVTFLYLGKLAPHKGVRLMLEAWGDGIRGARLLIAGDGTLEGEVREASARREDTSFLGWLSGEERTAALVGADAVLFPSLWPENFPLVVAEAMICGTPVITSTVASPPLVVHETSGLVVDPNPAAVRAAIERFVAEPALRDRLAAGARDLAAELDPERHVAALAEVYVGLANVD